MDTNNEPYITNSRQREETTIIATVSIIYASAFISAYIITYTPANMVNNNEPLVTTVRK
jgi:hypothetical protein